MQKVQHWYAEYQLIQHNKNPSFGINEHFFIDSRCTTTTVYPIVDFIIAIVNLMIFILDLVDKYQGRLGHYLILFYYLCATNRFHFITAVLVQQRKISPHKTICVISDVLSFQPISWLFKQLLKQNFKIVTYIVQYLMSLRYTKKIETCCLGNVSISIWLFHVIE